MDKDTLFSSFGKWLSPICSKMFHTQIAKSGQDKYVKKLTTLAYLKLFLHAQLQQREGLREIADDVLSKEFQRELGLETISAAQLSRKHSRVNPDLLQQIFERLAKQILSRHGCSIANRKALRIIDSTTVALCLQRYKWADFRKTKAGIKLHLRLAFADAHEVLPEKATITTARKNDRTQMDDLIHEEGITYVFDRGYVDYRIFDRYCSDGIYFATRLKENAMIEPLQSLEIPEDSKVTMDERVLVGSGQKRMKHKLRMVETTDSQSNLLILLTNRFDLSCDEISEMYRSRWAIETFFKWMKQHLKIKHFYGTSQQAAHNQVWLTLIAFCLLMLAKLDANVEHSLLQIQRWLKALMWKPYALWIGRMKRKPSRKSAGRRRLEPT
ncbi:IS4 family transposase [Paenibacillus sambharensis]|uniref:IS4 family transposase n=1 Tax=Paenibacillus sambharensis TaxID=1803190 RepID=A0A2W1LPY5_9BACL|nr:IS4 family transposase [Paenibacillus sambharensis]PZD96584.1 IS4 family transposase [Paenibacillus sambharensis]